MKRREFIKMSVLGAFFAPDYIKDEFFKKSDGNEELILAAINSDTNINGLSADETLNRIKILFGKEGRADLVLTPEYSFYHPRKPIQLSEENYGFSIDKKHSDEWARRILERGQEVACKYGSNLLLGTFAEADERIEALKGDNEPSNTLLHLGPDGRIMNRKRKTYGFEGEYKFRARNGKEYRFLPLICSDMLFERENMEKQKDEKFDVLAYSANDARWVDYYYLARHVQGILKKEQVFKIPLKDLTKKFREEFGYYSENFIGNCPIIISNGSRDRQGAILRYNLTSFPKYKDTPEYALASCYV